MNHDSNDSSSLFVVPVQPRTKTSDVLVSLMALSQGRTVTLRALTERLGDRTFGMVLVLIAIFNVIPFISFVAGLLICVLGLQMAFGRPNAWLPAFILDRPLPGERVKATLQTFEPRVRAIERFLKPRLAFSEAPIVDRINGVIIAILGLISALPIPLVNFIPAFVVLVMGLGLLERDGLVQICAATLGATAIVGFGWMFLIG